MSRTITLIAIAIAFSAVVAEDVHPIAGKVDLTRYQGMWYEQASIPQPYTGSCVCNTAQYTLRGSKLEVLNGCIQADGRKRSVHLSGVSRNPPYNTKLRVYFGPIGAPYWILAIGNTQNYDHVLVGEPSRRSLYILSRAKFLDETTYNQLIAVAQKEGYDTSKLVRDQNKKCYGGEETF